MGNKKEKEGNSSNSRKSLGAVRTNTRPSVSDAQSPAGSKTRPSSSAASSSSSPSSNTRTSISGTSISQQSSPTRPSTGGTTSPRRPGSSSSGSGSSSSTSNSPGANAAIEKAFAALDAELPIALLPVRIETVFHTNGSSHTLKVRIYPDLIHLDVHLRGLDERERTVGRQFWTDISASETSELARLEAFRGLAEELGPWRAAWVARETRDDGYSPETRLPDQPAVAKLLPDCWVVAGYRNGRLEILQAGSPIPPDLPVLPDLLTAKRDLKQIDELLKAQGLQWMVDFDEAVAKGMALEIPISRTIADEGIGELIVLGVRKPAATPGDAETLEAALEAHRYTRGIDFVPAGTPTNNTETARSGVSVRSPELEDVLAIALETQTGAARRTASPDRDDPYNQSFADATVGALGLTKNSILGRLPAEDHNQLNLAWAMNAALWPVTWGHFLRTMLNVGLSDSDLNWVRDHFVNFVRASGPLPALRIGEQPYGLLPVGLPADSNGTDRISRLEAILEQLQSYWQTAVRNVAQMDPDASDASAASGTARTSASDESALTTTVARILAGQPTMAQLRLRTVSSYADHYQESFTWSHRLSFSLVMMSWGGEAKAVEYLERLDAATTIEDQLAVVTEGYNALNSAIRTASGDKKKNLEEGRDFLRDTTLPFFKQHQQRIRPVLSLGIDRKGVSGRVNDKGDPALFFGMFSEKEREWGESPLVSAGRTAEDLEWVSRWMKALIKDTVSKGGELKDPKSKATTTAYETVWSEFQAERASGSTAPSPPAPPQPLLYQLLSRAIKVLHKDDVGSFLQGLLALSFSTSPTSKTAVRGNPLGELERLMLDTLGLATHRLDAWRTSIAARQLAERRQKHPEGLQVGAYGWVVNLKKSGAPTSQGYIHTPSLNHAATAAALRSGWSAMGDGSMTAPLSIDLSSDRVRRAEFLLDGVRQGHRLETLLGYRLERRLHDGQLDHYIDDVRKAVLEATGRGGEPAIGVVDGLLLARAFCDDQVTPKTPLEGEVEKAVKARLSRIKDPSDRAKLETVLKSLTEDFDAAADALLCQGVHNLLTGNTAAASASLESISSGETAPPELEVARTGRSGRAITHRLMILLPANTTSTTRWRGSSFRPEGGTTLPTGVACRPLALAEPRLERWVAFLLGYPNEFVYELVWKDPSGRELARVPQHLCGEFCFNSHRRPGTLQPAARCGLSTSPLAALDTLFAFPDGSSFAGSRIDGWIRTDVELRRSDFDVPDEAQLEIDYEPAAALDAGQRTLADLQLVALSLRELLLEGRPLEPGDFAGPGQVIAADVPTAEIDARASNLRTLLEEARDVLKNALPLEDGSAPRGDLAAALQALQPFYLDGPRSFNEPLRQHAQGIPEGTVTLLAEGRALLARVNARLEKATGSPVEQLRALTGVALPILPSFEAPDAAPLERNFSNTRLRVGVGKPPPLAWVQQAARVRAGAQKLTEAIDLIEAVRETSLFDLRVAQLPDVSGEAWAATTLPKSPPAGPAGGRVSIVACSSSSTSLHDGNAATRVAGLKLDSWVEVIPAEQTTTGLAVHFDAPGAQPPQAVLLGVCPSSAAWSMDGLLSLLRSTLQHARERAVGPEALIDPDGDDTFEGVGQYLPAIYLGTDATPG